MRFSIAVPVYQQAKLLSSALDSISAQKCPFQLAVMDATPDDSVQKVLASYPDDLLTYRRHGPDAGQSAAIQEGWDHTDGEIVAWLCADDYYFPYTFEEVEKIFRSHPDVDVVYGDCVFINREGDFMGYFPEISDKISSITRSCCIAQPSCFVRREVLNKIGPLDLGLHYIMDWDLWTRLYKAGAKFHYLQKPLSVARIYRDTKTASRSKNRYNEIYNHLRTNAGFYYRIRSMFGFYYQDLLSGRESLIDGMAFSGINLLRSFKAVLRKQASIKATALYGIESYSNKVFGECEVALPWYGDRPPREVLIKTKNMDSLEAYANGDMVNVVSVDSCDGFITFTVDIVKLSTELVILKLVSKQPYPWQLVSLHLN